MSKKKKRKRAVKDITRMILALAALITSIASIVTALK
jgi:hypothetical protein